MKRFAVLLLTLAMAFCCAAPAFAAGTIEVTEDVSVSDDYDWTRFQGQNLTLNVYNWGEYISNGSDDSVDVVAAFEKLTGIKVNYTTFDSNESMYAKLKSGAADYDVVIPSDYMVAKMIAEGMLKPLNYDNIPNFKKINQEYVDPDYDPQNAYTVPYMLCTTGIIYNTKYVEEPTGWDVLWDERYAGKILMFNNSRDAFGIAESILGYSLNTEDEAELQACADLLAEQKPLVQQYVMDEIFNLMANEEAWVAPYYAGDFLTMAGDNENLAWYLPEDQGFNVFIDAMCIPTSCEHKEEAETFINFLCDPEISGKNMSWIGYGTPETAAKEFLPAEMAENEVSYPDTEILEHGESFLFLTDATNQLMDSLWLEAKSS